MMNVMKILSHEHQFEERNVRLFVSIVQPIVQVHLTIIMTNIEVNEPKIKHAESSQDLSCSRNYLRYYGYRYYTVIAYRKQYR